MAGLISDQLLANMRTVAYKELLTPVTVSRMTPTEGSMGTTTTESTVIETTCWVKPQFKGNLEVQPGGLVGQRSSSEIRFRFGTDVQVGDYLTVDSGAKFQVQDTNAEATIALYLKAWAERID